MMPKRKYYDMAILLRVDVDNPYGYKTFREKTLNYLALKYDFPKIDTLGYLRYLKILLKDLEERGITATFFFKTTTIPKTNLRNQILKKHEVGFHAVRTRTFNEFSKDFNKVNIAFKGEVYGMSKHGSGIWVGKEKRHTREYNVSRCIKYAKKLGLKYFSGNDEDPRMEKTVVNGIIYYPSAFWINKKRRKPQFTIEWLIEESSRKDIVVLLHPYEWATQYQIYRDYEKIVNLGDKFKTFTEVSK